MERCWAGGTNSTIDLAESCGRCGAIEKDTMEVIKEACRAVGKIFGAPMKLTHEESPEQFIEVWGTDDLFSAGSCEGLPIYFR